MRGHGGGEADPGGVAAGSRQPQRGALPLHRAAAGRDVPRRHPPDRFQPRRRPHLRRLEALRLPLQPRHRLRHQPRHLPLPIPPRRPPRRQRPGRPGTPQDPAPPSILLSSPSSPHLLCFSLKTPAGVHGGGARGHVGGAVVEYQRGGRARAGVAGGGRQGAGGGGVREGGAGEDPEGCGGLRLRGDPAQGLHLLGHRLLGRQPRPHTAARPAADPPGLPPRQGLLRHRRRPGGLPQPPRAARQGRRRRRRQRAGDGDGGRTAAAVGGDSLGGTEPAGPLRPAVVGIALLTYLPTYLPNQRLAPPFTF